jgi:hypothetical protein
MGSARVGSNCCAGLLQSAEMAGLCEVVPAEVGLYSCFHEGFCPGALA